MEEEWIERRGKYVNSKGAMCTKQGGWACGEMEIKFGNPTEIPKLVKGLSLSPSFILKEEGSNVNKFILPVTRCLLYSAVLKPLSLAASYQKQKWRENHHPRSLPSYTTSLTYSCVLDCIDPKMILAFEPCTSAAIR